jgi:hypothetical protein
MPYPSLPTIIQRVAEPAVMPFDGVLSIVKGDNYMESSLFSDNQRASHGYRIKQN